MGVYLGGPTIEVLFDTQGPCPDGFHVPLKSERTTLNSILSSTFGLNYGERYLKMPRAGYRIGYSGGVDARGTYGYYRSSSGGGNGYANYEYFYSGTPSTLGDSSATGCNIRPFKNDYVIPDSTWSVLYQGTGTAGIYHNSSLGLISISSDGTTRYTISDKNLGATTVYNYGDTLSADNCGGYFQRGNNYMFPYSGSVTTSSTQVNAGNYGPGNYYNSSTFIISSNYPYKWDTSNNQNIRGGVSQGTSTKTIYPELKNAYIGEVYEYSYDFRNKSSTILTNDGWTISSTSGMSFNSDGIYLNGAYTPNIHRNLGVSLNDAKYIKYIMNWKFIGDVGMGCTLITRVDTDDSTQNGLANNKNNSVASVGWYIQGTRTFKQNISAGNYVQSLKFDLENKTMLLDVNGSTYTGTLTDANVTSLKTNNNLKLYLGQYPSTTPQVYVASIGIEVGL